MTNTSRLPVLKLPSARLPFGSTFLKWSSLMAEKLTPSRGTDTEVARTYAALTLLRGTPLSLWGPATKSRPDLSLESRTTLFPLNFPASRIKTFPGVKVLLSRAGLATFLFLRKCFFSSSAGYHVLDLLVTFLRAAPPNAMLRTSCYISAKSRVVPHPDVGGRDRL
jgi:hypothetical protein